jgi:hypothetical protein
VRLAPLQLAQRTVAVGHVEERRQMAVRKEVRDRSKLEVAKLAIGAPHADLRGDSPVLDQSFAERPRFGDVADVLPVA